MAKIDVLNKALEMGLDANESMTVSQIQALIDAAEGGGEAVEQKPSHYQEWDVRIKSEAYEEYGQKKSRLVHEKIKISREVVKISDEEAETLKAGVYHSANNIVKMYFKPNAEENA